MGDTASSYSEPRRPAPAPARPSGPSRALKLGKKARDADSFVDQLQSEGEHVAPRAPAGGPAAARAAPVVPVTSEPVSLLVAEKLTLVAPRDGGLQNLELHGQMTLRITDESLARLQVQVSPRGWQGDVSRGRAFLGKVCCPLISGLCIPAATGRVKCTETWVSL